MRPCSQPMPEQNTTKETVVNPTPLLFIDLIITSGENLMKHVGIRLDVQYLGWDLTCCPNPHIAV